MAEALGSLDETNSYLGLCKVAAGKSKFKLCDKKFSDIVQGVQENLFIVQAEVAGAKKTISAEKITEIETFIDAAEKELPPIKTFFISGGTELAALFDVARTISRRAERRVVFVRDEGMVKISKDTASYLNRLSSLLYALARLTNHKSEIKEKAPSYE